MKGLFQQVSEEWSVKLLMKSKIKILFDWLSINQTTNFLSSTSTQKPNINGWKFTQVKHYAANIVA